MGLEGYSESSFCELQLSSSVDLPCAEQILVRDVGERGSVLRDNPVDRSLVNDDGAILDLQLH